MPETQRVEIEWGGRKLSLETGRIARQADAAVLAQYGFGRAHHRVLHFVHRNPGLRVANLLEILKITKQSLARVLKQLIGEGFITQRAGAEDRRERLLYATAKGARLAEKLTTLQTKRVETALEKAGAGADAATRRRLQGEVDRLAGSDGMGTLFKVLSTVPRGTSLPSFTFAPSD